MIKIRDDGLEVVWSDGKSFVFHPLWLRERSFDASNKDPATGHRVQEVAFLPLNLSIARAKLDGNDGVSIDFSDGHSCRYDFDDLRHCVDCPLPDDLVGEKVLWDASLNALPWHQYDELKSSPFHLLELLDSLATLGFALVRGMGSHENELAAFAALFGPIRETNWGRIADVKSIANGYCLSMTGRALEPHVDNPYRLPGPGYIFLHCLENSAEGGESIIVDGFNAAAKLAVHDPAAYDTLSRALVTFRYADNDAILEHHGTLIEHDVNGRLVRVRFHNRADQVVAKRPAELAAYYRARREFAELLWSDRLTVRFKLRAGETYIVDNYRILHGRTEIKLATGNRHLRQCYMDRDIVSSRQKILLRSLQ
ncbi:TauD/TfdA family dioxygenase [Dongia deserti]|uniref:TauD/TfdA family dioxygenase n=1 Tax=Dongia deserti TaxID=2268030 RepID=UPI000E653CEE|nr:TauD/TfdA family dioxygenase [Dongia deserti]